jgi:hypothetical protein
MIDADPDATGERGAHAIGRLVLDAVLAALIGDRLNVKELAARSLALAVYCRHWRLHGLSTRAVAVRAGISHTALLARLRKVPVLFTVPTRKPKSSTRKRGKRAATLPRRPKGKCNISKKSKAAPRASRACAAI